MSRAQRIAFVAPRFAEGGTVGGAETLLRALAARARAAGRDVEFLTTCARDHFTWANEVAPGLQDREGLPVRFFPVDTDRDLDRFLRAQDRISRRAHTSIAEEHAWLDNGINSRALVTFLTGPEARYDRVVVGPYLFGLTGAVCRAVPAAACLLPCLHDEAFAAMRTVRELFCGVDRILFNAGAEAALARRLYEVDAARCFVVGMGIDAHAADPARGRAAAGAEAPYLLYCGRREPLKGTPLLLDYFQAFCARTGRDVRLVLTGSGSFETPPAVRDRVRDLGFVDERTKRDLMAGALAFCQPSVNESFSIVLLEAWQSGTAALVHAGSAVMQEHCRRSRGGLWFRHYAEFEAELLLLLERPATRNAMARAGQAYVQAEYAWPAIVERLLHALDADLPPR